VRGTVTDAVRPGGPGAGGACGAGGAGGAADRRDPPGARDRMVAELAGPLGSRQEAVWIVEHAGVEGAPALARRRLTGEPLQYVLGRWPFRSVELQVDPRVLIPRPETEQVVEVALGELARSVRYPGTVDPDPDAATTASPSGDLTPRVVVDLGTGSGAMALALAVEGPGVGADPSIWATDASDDALEVARANRETLGRTDGRAAERVHLVPGSWFDALPVELAGRVDLVVSNPPYVTESEYPHLDPTVRLWEPRAALVAPADGAGVAGMADIAAIVAGAPRWLAPGGALVVEIAPSLARPAVEAARAAGFTRVSTPRDLAGRIRMLVAGR